MRNQPLSLRRAAPILLIGFGLLICLIAAIGVGALQRTRDTYRNITPLNEDYRRTEEALDAIGGEVYGMGLLAWDFLLARARNGSEQYRTQLLALRSISLCLS